MTYTDLDLVSRAKAGDRAAASDLVTSHMGMIRSAARRWRHHVHEIEDLVQSGAIGLLQAIPRYDPSRGSHFRDYARIHIRNAIRLEAYAQLAQGRGGESVARSRCRFHLDRHRSALAYACTQPDPVSAVQKALGCRQETAWYLIFRGERDVHLADPITGKGRRTYGEVLPMDQDTPEEETYWRELSSRLRSALRALPPRWRAVIQARYLGDPICTLREVADQLGVSGERARQIEDKAIERLVDWARQREGGSYGD